MSNIRHLINVVFLAALCVTVGHTCGHVSPSLRFQLAGFTSTLHLGDTGVLGLTLACQAEFPGSRMCTSEEVMETTSVPATLSGEAWVRPVYGAAMDDYRFLETASGHLGYPGNSLACRGWTMGNETGLFLDAAGRLFGSGQCSQPRAVSCCALLP